MGDEGGCVLEGRESCEGEKKRKGLPSGWGIARRGPKPMESWKPVRMKGTVLGGEHLCVRVHVRVRVCARAQRLEWLRKEEPAALRLILPPLSQHGPRHPHRATAENQAAGDLEGSSALVAGVQSASLSHRGW